MLIPGLWDFRNNNSYSSTYSLYSSMQKGNQDFISWFLAHHYFSSLHEPVIWNWCWSRAEMKKLSSWHLQKRLAMPQAGLLLQQQLGFWCSDSDFLDFTHLMLKQQQVCTCLRTILIKFHCLHMLYLGLNITCENFKFYFKQVNREEENVESFKYS